MIEILGDTRAFRQRRRDVWERNVTYWLRAELRHVVDVGDHIVNRVAELCRATSRSRPRILDMGFGSGWLLERMLDVGISPRYTGVDALEAFVSQGRIKFAGKQDASFLVGDLESEITLGEEYDIAVNAFNFFELCDLITAMGNAGRHLVTGGRLLMSTIDKTYLILALSRDWADFHANLKLYGSTTSIKCGFQRIDLGDCLSEVLEYPSVLYSTEDYIEAASKWGLKLTRYEEHAFTARTVPKIYCHLEFTKAI